MPIWIWKGKQTRHNSANSNLGPMLLVIMAIEGYQPLLFPGLARLELLWEGSTWRTYRKGKVQKAMVQSKTFANWTKWSTYCYLKYKKEEGKLASEPISCVYLCPSYSFQCSASHTYLLWTGWTHMGCGFLGHLLPPRQLCKAGLLIPEAL